MSTRAIIAALSLVVLLALSAVGAVFAFAWSQVRTAEIDAEGERYTGNLFLRDVLAETVALVRENT